MSANPRKAWANADDELPLIFDALQDLIDFSATNLTPDLWTVERESFNLEPELLEPSSKCIENLKACSLVSRTWRVHSQHRLFQVVRLKSLDKVSVLNSVLEATGFSPRVRRVIFSQSSHFLFPGQDLVDLLSRLPNLKLIATHYHVNTPYDSEEEPDDHGHGARMTRFGSVTWGVLCNPQSPITLANVTHLHWPFRTTLVALAAILNAMPNLTHLWYWSNLLEPLPIDGFTVRPLHNLQYLGIFGFTLITLEDYLCLFSPSPGVLQSLELFEGHFADHGPENVPTFRRFAPGLRELRIMPKLPGDIVDGHRHSLRYLILPSSNLHTLTLCGQRFVTNFGSFKELPVTLKHLRLFLWAEADIEETLQALSDVLILALRDSSQSAVRLSSLTIDCRESDRRRPLNQTELAEVSEAVRQLQQSLFEICDKLGITLRIPHLLPPRVIPPQWPHPSSWFNEAEGGGEDVDMEGD